MATSSDDEAVRATVEVLAFDLYGTLVDPIRITTALEQVAPGDSDRLAALWRSTQLEYTFRLTAMGAYEDFECVTRKALDQALALVGRELGQVEREMLMAGTTSSNASPTSSPAWTASGRPGTR